MRRTPLKRKRDRPRRKAPERVQYERIKPRAREKPTAQERRHIARVAEMPCLVSGRPATVHHVTSTIHGGRLRRSPRRVVPLAPEYHQIIFDPKISDPLSVERLSHRGFFEKYGIDLFAEAERLWEESRERDDASIRQADR